ncbi:MAG: PaaI family thioesterase [Devosia sp.]
MPDATSQTPSPFKERTVRWAEPSRSAADQGADASGLETVRGIRDGRIPPPPLVQIMGIECVLAEHGEVGMRLDHDGSLENFARTIHGGAVATMLDTAMGAAVNTTLDAGAAVVTLDLSVSYLRPARAEDCPLAATGRLVHAGKRNAYAIGEVRDRQQRLIAHAVGNFTILGIPT